MVGLLSLRFTFLTAAEQDYRELGVLKAIGLAPRAIKRIYLAKYALLAAVTATLGLLAGWALAPLLSRNITRYMGSATSVWNWIVPTAAAASVFVVLVLFVLVLLRRFNNIGAVTALRAGATGQQSKAVRLRLHRSRLPVHFNLGTIDVVSRWPTCRAYRYHGLQALDRYDSGRRAGGPQGGRRRIAVGRDLSASPCRAGIRRRPIRRSTRPVPCHSHRKVRAATVLSVTVMAAIASRCSTLGPVPNHASCSAWAPGGV